MMPNTFSFNGDATTIFGLVGVTSTFVILISIFRSYWSSPYNK